MIKDDKKRTHIIVTGKGGGGGSDAGAVRFDEAQVLTEEEKTQARNNIGAADVNNIPTATSDLDNDSGFITINDVPAQVNADWNAVSGAAEILNKPTILTEWFGTQAEYDLIDPKDPNTVYHIEGGQPVQSDWNEADNTSLAYIQNKPTIPAAQVQSDWNAVSGVAQILNKPTIPAAPVQSDWNEADSSSLAYIANKPTIPTVPAMTTQELTFTLQDGTVKKFNFYIEPNYFYVEDISGSDNTLSITKDNASAPTIEVFKSTDKVNWSSIGNTSTTAITATIPANGKLYLKATTNAWGANPYTLMGNKITASGNHNVGGNIMSLLYGDSFINQTTLNNYSFCRLFGNNTKLVNAGNLELPATTLAQGCYQTMFSECTALTTAPELPATTLAGYCYNAMFYNCTALTTAPALPATTLAQNCYSGMFYNCKALTTAPALPATTLATECYGDMFNGCTSLTTAPALPATTLANSCYHFMFRKCTSLTTAPELPATTLVTECYREMFIDCKALTTAPALPATTLVQGCYNCMFQGCTSLTTSPVLPATILTTSCYNWMFKSCRALNSVTTYAQDISASGCLNDWLDGVSATGDFYNLGGATYTSGKSGIPSGWTEHTSL